MMSLLSFIAGSEDEVLKRYKRLRERGRELNDLLIKQLTKTAIRECAKKLGLLEGKTLVLDREDELSVLFDYCLYSHRLSGKNTIDRYLESSSTFALLDDERLLLKAMADSYYSLFLVDAVQPGKGGILSDLLRDETLFLMDIGLGQSARPGLMLAGRVLRLPDFNMTSGALIPVEGDDVRQQVALILKNFLKHKDPGDVVLSPGQEAAFSAQVIRALLRSGLFDRIRYKEI
ncbi:MAG: hypothetical protein ACFCVA_13125 [Gammaproteobacteria bacterium]